jgi:hypothetical protein
MFSARFIFCILSIPFFLNTQNISFDWLIGKWKLQSDKSESYEEWRMDGKRLSGESYSIQNGIKEINEKLFLEKFDKQWAYIAIPGGQAITLFALSKTEDSTFVFENPEHDFPQRIIYAYDGKNTINASIEGEKNGAFKRITFSFKRVP